MSKKSLRQAKPEDVRRLARWLKIKDIDKMSHRQLIRMLDWLFKRAEKKRRGMAWDY